ncbi:MAG: fused MFS/spermidine synthase [Deltaproteobacteria bacterium]|nr:fused MFS/spermidine synthase [Deltaproteobacteria bacterium]
MFFFAAAIGLAAFLVFALQPLLGKVLLPWFGGGPAVWSTCLMFFQLALLVGYLWAHGLVRLSPRKQAALQLGLLGAGLLALAIWAWLWPSPLTPDASWKPPDESLPVLRILVLLGLSAGLPFMALAATSPLLQAWVHRIQPDRSPYRLYALSNTGSLAALLAYPLAIEPVLGVRAQAWAWAGLFVLYAVSTAACAGLLLRRPPDAGLAEEGLTPSRSATRRTGADEPRPCIPTAPARPSRPVHWFGLSMCGSVLLLAFTDQICRNLAVVPFLWIGPLALYLLTFVLCFADERLARRSVFAPLFFVFAGLTAAMLFHGSEKTWSLGRVEIELGILGQVLICAACLFSGCMLLHGELARRRPPAARLTAYYLAMSAGGAAGGVFVSLLAPLVFDGYGELNLGLAATAAFGAASVLFDSKLSPTNRRVGGIAAAAAGLMLCAALAFQPWHFAREALETRRNFYGVLRVLDKHPGAAGYHARDLMDGQVLHGYQLQDPTLRRVPTSYFSHRSGLGLVLAHHQKRRAEPPLPLRVGLIGLGIGTAAAHGRSGDLLRFYEINPDVIRLARGEGRHFSFLTDSPARIEVVAGDARVSLERELMSTGGQGFDVLVLDAFQSDAIPVHLLDLEAFQLYLAHLAAGGVMALHITNLHLELEPVVDRLCDELGLSCAVVRDPGDGWISLRSHWMLVARETELLGLPAIAERCSLPERLEPGPAPLWTDDFSSLLDLLR